eukprot:16432365-Heterocapsa_arctica.AAC.1
MSKTLSLHHKIKGDGSAITSELRRQQKKLSRMKNTTFLSGKVEQHGRSLQAQKVDIQLHHGGNLQAGRDCC